MNDGRPDHLPARRSFGQVIGILEARLAVRPCSYALREQLGIVCLRFGDLDRALEHCRAALRLARALDDGGDRRFVLSGAYANLAAVHAARNEPAREWEALLAGLAIRPESGCLNYQLAIRLIRDGDVDGALMALQTACSDPRSYPRDWFSRYAQHDQQLAPLHRDPRFRRILASEPAA